ncbi:hypothetical protein PanWU01x14_154400 [Parasponia andersonii]|uniref:Uncharacterized protein n=1 Tax=Parasponia andersonii TaxID=3476 RepID=A0A2P5CGW2_PARAD|nr:hypothetical protein PanWU01x14_154400 [Parasponia andersonii]
MENSKKGLLSFKHGIHLSKGQCPKATKELDPIRHAVVDSALNSIRPSLPVASKASPLASASRS